MELIIEKKQVVMKSRLGTDSEVNYSYCDVYFKKGRPPVWVVRVFFANGDLKKEVEHRADFTYPFVIE